MEYYKRSKFRAKLRSFLLILSFNYRDRQVYDQAGTEISHLGLIKTDNFKTFQKGGSRRQCPNQGIIEKHMVR